MASVCLCVLSVRFWQAHVGVCVQQWSSMVLATNVTSTFPDILLLDSLWFADSATWWKQTFFYWAALYFLNRTPSDMAQILKCLPFSLVSHIWAVNWNCVHFRWYICNSKSRREHRDAMVTRDLVCMSSRARAPHQQHRTQEPRLGKEVNHREECTHCCSKIALNLLYSNINLNSESWQRQ